MPSRMEFYRRNLVNTTTMLYATAGQTGTSAALFDRDIAARWVSTGAAGATAAVLSVRFSEPTVVSNIMLLGHNLSQYRLFYDSATSNTFTPAISVSGGSVAFTYFDFASITVSSIDLQMDSAFTTTVAGSFTTEKVVGDLIVTRRLITTGRNPSAQAYRPVLRKSAVHQTLADGGTAIYYLADKFAADFRLLNITSAYHSALKSIYDNAVPFVFAPNPTISSWDGDAFECVWPGAFDFKWAENDKGIVGYNGTVRLAQTSGGIGRRPA